jgi:RimJ/RimL family protein N-acetyltransferase
MAGQDEHVIAVCTADTFRPHPADGVRWWAVEDYVEASRAYEGLNPESTWYAEEDWRQLYGEGYRYCSVLVDGRTVSTAGLWPHSEHAWEVIAVFTRPEFRNKGYGKAVVSSVTQEILDAGKAATLHTHRDNTAMRRVATALGYIER